MNLFDILSHDERIIVLSNEGDQRIITWNQSATLQAFEQGNDWDDPRDWEEVGIRTLSSCEPKNYVEARIKALEWQGEMWSHVIGP